MAKRLLCLIGMHNWQVRYWRNRKLHDRTYYECGRCGKIWQQR